MNETHACPKNGEEVGGREGEGEGEKGVMRVGEAARKYLEDHSIHST